jgi:alpha-tubulin suppressor-like RCC1 family protein
MKRSLSLVLSLLPALSSAHAFASADTRLPQGATIALGGDATYLLRPDGTTWAWGYNSAGQVGDGGAVTMRKNPVQISITCTQISAGESFALCIAPDNTLYSWGLNGYSQLGRTGSIYYPASVGSTSDWRSVAAGYDHALGIKFDGTLYAWGNNAQAQLGLPDKNKRTTPAKVNNDTDWIAVAAGMNFSLALKANGYLYGSGTNSSGQMATGDTAAIPLGFQKIGSYRWKAISAGLSHVMAIREDGALYVWGANANSQVGNNGSTDVKTPYKITAAATWRTMAAGWSHSTAIASDGTLWVWGSNTKGELGLGTTSSTPQKTPKKVGTGNWYQYVAAAKNITMVMEADGSVGLWGSGLYGQLGNGSTGDHSSWTVPWPYYDGDAWNYGNKPQLPGAGSYHSMIVGRDGMLRTWGDDRNGELGDGALDASGSSDKWVPAIRTYESPFIFASGSEEVTHAIKSDGTMWAWGGNQAGELGITAVAANDHQLTPAQVGSATNWVKTAEHYEQMIAMQADGTLWGCGDNFNGLLGINVPYATTASVRTLTKVVTPSGKFWAAVAVSEENAYGITTSGELYSWGNRGSDSTRSQLGRGAKDPALGSPKPVLVDGGFTDWVAVGAGLGWAVAVRANGQAYTFGAAPNGSSGTPTLVTSSWRMMLLAVTRFSILATGPSGAIIGWGRNDAGELGMDSSGSVTTVQQTDYYGIRAIAGGADHFVAVDAISSDGHASGGNYSGQLGDGTETGRSYPVSISFPFFY